MIDIRTERLLPVKELPGYLESRGLGKRVTVGTVKRWIRDGCDGVRLEAVRVGGMTFTSIDAVQRWVEAQSAANDRSAGSAPQPTESTRSSAISTSAMSPRAAASRHYLIESRVVPTALDRVIETLKDQAPSARGHTVGVLFRSGLRTPDDVRRTTLDALLAIDRVGPRSAPVIKALWATLKGESHPA